ncbi:MULTISPECIES: PAS domain-containing protein [unclassified Rubrivivax]|uniref:PAS domain-containing protein n=1 Tax=unclassified Rubrivivax TaxID=2649762 RepID=UPI0013E94A8F|nr:MULTISPECIES: PAS domain-containing protein [unclassified Rubrivivax]MCC9597213.1 PAS domain-containing protein [Rubrivivax sp. JA1055]MCC9646528.1 PAS domain-containing protein [Rubrivivax sp. JA1029]MCD0416813.1 PAS domain-containing protein [Rubrivivax sp. JA1024]
MPRRATTTRSSPAAPAAERRDWFEALPAAVGALAADGSVERLNAAARALLGIEAFTAGMPAAQLLGLDDDGADALARCCRGLQPVELRRQAAAGPRWLALTPSRLDDGTTLLALASRDAEHAREAELVELHALLDVAASVGRLGRWDRDLQTGRGHWDRRVFAMRGLDGEGEAPSPEEAERAIVAADREGFVGTIRQTLQQPGRHRYRYHVRTPAGQVRSMLCECVVLPDEQGRAWRAVGFLVDDTLAWSLAHSHDSTMSQIAMAADMTGIALWRHDLHDDRVHYNPRAAQILGLPLEPRGLPAGQVRELVHPQDLLRLDAQRQACLASDEPVDTELRYRRPGSENWRSLLVRRAVERDDQGRPVAFIGVAMDVTERVDESRRAAELGRRFELVTRAAGIGYWSVEPLAGGHWNEQLRTMHGLQVHEPVPSWNEWLQRFVHPDDRQRVGRRFDEWRENGMRQSGTVFRIVRADGEVRELSVRAGFDGPGGDAMFGIVLDVTERRRAEAALHQASERAMLAARGAGVGTWELDVRDGSAIWDEQMWRLRGRPPRSTPPTIAERLGFVHEADRDTMRLHLLEPLNPASEPDLEFRVVWPDGTVRWIAERSTVLPGPDGRPRRRIGVEWDITDRRAAEAARQERAIALRESQAKSRFLSRMSHELRTPLNAVLGFTELLLADSGSRDGSWRRHLQAVRGAGQQLLALVDDVLDLASLEGGEMRVASERVALRGLALQALELVEPLRGQRDVTVIAGTLDGIVLADAVRLRQVLQNLLTNAIKYNRDGGLVEIESRRRDGKVLVSVADSGRGMTEQQLRHLFEPFNRLGLEREGIPGTGIGLVIVKSLVERMGGSISVRSTPGVGTVVELVLADGTASPTPPPTPPRAARPLPAAAPGSSSGTVLYVEDNPVNALIVSELVARRSDLRLVIADDGASGVRRAAELRPDLILLDMQLPDIDGHEVMRQLRAQPQTASIPVVALSANAMPEEIERALAAGMADYWTKPLDFRAFMVSLEAMFGPPPP